MRIFLEDALHCDTHVRMFLYLYMTVHTPARCVFLKYRGVASELIQFGTKKIFTYQNLDQKL